jgi:hypothetical protein
MSLETKLKKAKRLGIEFEEGKVPDERKLDELIEQKQAQLAQDKEEAKIRKAEEKRAAEEARKHQIILKDVDGDDVEQAEYFWPRLVEETVKTPSGEKTLKPTTETAPSYFNKECGFPVDDPDLIDVFVQYFPRKKGFLFYKTRGKELYLVIVPLKYATTISAANESRPGDFQRHALSFIAEGSVNIDSLKLKLARIAKHSSISTEPLAR